MIFIPIRIKLSTVFKKEAKTQKKSTNKIKTKKQ